MSVVSATTMASRCLGFFRDMLLASLFPASLVDPFIVAFRIPNALRRFVSEGAFSISVVPVYSKCSSEAQQKQLLNSLFTLLSVLLSLLTLGLIICAPELLALYAPGFKGDVSVIGLVRLMLPYLAFLSLVALAMGVLNSHQRFFSPAAAPILLNLCFIGTMLFTKHMDHDTMTWIAWGVVVSGLLQFLFQLPFLKSVDRLPRLTSKLWSKDIQRIGSLWLPAMWSVSIIQLTTLVGTRFATLLPEGTVTGLYLGERVVELPLGVFAVAIGTASLPVLSKLVKDNDMDSFHRAVNHSLVLSQLFAIPAAVGIYVLSDLIVKAFYFRRSFDESTMAITVDCLRLYAMAVPFGALLRSFASAFHAFERMRIPAVISTCVLVVYTTVCFATYEEFRHKGLAFGSSLSVFLNSILLIGIFHLSVKKLRFGALLKSLSKILIAACVMGLGVLYAYRTFFNLDQLNTELEKWSALLSLCFGGMVVYFIAILVLDVSESRVLLEKIKRRLGF